MHEQSKIPKHGEGTVFSWENLGHDSRSAYSAGTGSLDVVWLQSLSPTGLYQLVELASEDAHIPAGRTEKPLEPGFRWRLVYSTPPENSVMLHQASVPWCLMGVFCRSWQVECTVIKQRSATPTVPTVTNSLTLGVSPSLFKSFFLLVLDWNWIHFMPNYTRTVQC